MKKVINESVIRQIVSEAIKNILMENDQEEGYAWDAYKDAFDYVDGEGKSPSWDDIKYNIKGQPDAKKHHLAKMHYNTSKGCSPEDLKKNNQKNSLYHAEDALWHEPGVSGQLKRGAITAGLLAKHYGKKIGNKLTGKK